MNNDTLNKRGDTWTGFRPSVIEDDSKVRREKERFDDAVSDFFDSEDNYLIKERASAKLSIQDKADLARKGITYSSDIKVPSHGFTHAGIFHADEVFATAILKKLNPDFEVIRGFEVPENFDGIVYDIGEGEYDHHQKDKESRGDFGESPYASFGLIWRDFGEAFCDGDIELAARIDRNFITKIDLSDNGGEFNPVSKAISAFNPSWSTQLPSTKENEEQNGKLSKESFDKAVEFAAKALDNVILHERNRVNLSVSSGARCIDSDTVYGDYCDYYDCYQNISKFTNLHTPDIVNKIKNESTTIHVSLPNPPSVDQLFALAYIKEINPKTNFVFSNQDISKEDIYLDLVSHNKYDYLTGYSSNPAFTGLVRKANVPLGLTSTLAYIFSDTEKTNPATDVDITSSLLVHYLQGVDFSIFFDYSLLSELITSHENIEQNIEMFRSILDKEIASVKEFELADTTFKEIVENTPSEERNIICLDRYIPFAAVAAQYEDIKYVIYPSRGEYAIQGAKESLAARNIRVPFPERWTGAEESVLRNEIPGFRFCHPSNFLASAETKEAALAIAEKSLEEYKERLAKINQPVYEEVL